MREATYDITKLRMYVLTKVGIVISYGRTFVISFDAGARP